MGDASERSEAPGQRSEAPGLRSEAPGLPPRCPCGFWGSSKTMNLCSKCFADVQKKQPTDDCSSPPLSGSSSQSTIFETSSSQLRSMSPPMEQLATNEVLPAFAREGETETARGTLCTPTKRLRDADLGAECEATMEKRVCSVDKDGVGLVKQKNRRRCFRCQTKLELVQQELGSCRCGFVFCMRHRLPEQHDCLFDHLGRGREDAVLKMVKLDRKVGRSCQRIGEECS